MSDMNDERSVLPTCLRQAGAARGLHHFPRQFIKTKVPVQNAQARRPG